MQGGLIIKGGDMARCDLAVMFGDAVDMGFQFWPTGKTIFACDDILGIGQTSIIGGFGLEICGKALLGGGVLMVQGLKQFLPLA